MNARTRIAVIGLGEAGADLHLPALDGIPSAVLVGACDRDERRRVAVAARRRVPIFDDIDAMLDDTAPDVVIVATPPASHAEHCLRALAHGAHVICEKPFVCSLMEADQVLAAAGAAKRQVALNHEFAQMPIFRTLVDHVHDRAAGGLQFVQVWQMVNLPQSREEGWRGEMAHRTLFEAGVHLIDLIVTLFGERPLSVQASTSGGVNAEHSDAVVVATLEFSGGRLAQLTQNRLCTGQPQYVELRADTAHGSFRASFGGRARVSAGLLRSGRPHVRVEYGSSGVAWREDGPRRRYLARNPAQPNVIGTREVLKDAFAAFGRGGRPRADGRRGRDVLEVVAGCYLSAMTGNRVRLDASTLDGLRRFRMGGPSNAYATWPSAFHASSF